MVAGQAGREAAGARVQVEWVEVDSAVAAVVLVVVVLRGGGE